MVVTHTQVRTYHQLPFYDWRDSTPGGWFLTTSLLEYQERNKATNSPLVPSVARRDITGPGETLTKSYDTTVTITSTVGPPSPTHSTYRAVVTIELEDWSNTTHVVLEFASPAWQTKTSSTSATNQRQIHSTSVSGKKSIVPSITPRDVIPMGYPTPTDSYDATITVTLPIPTLVITHTVIGTSEVFDWENQSSIAVPLAGHTLQTRLSNSRKIDRISPTSNTDTRNPTNTGTFPAATTSRSAGNSLRVVSPDTAITYVSTLGGQGGAIGLLITGLFVLVGVAAFL